MTGPSVTQPAGFPNAAPAGPVTRWCVVHGDRPEVCCHVLGLDGKTYPAHPLPTDARAHLAADYLADGLTQTEIAERLGVSVRTVRADLDRTAPRTSVCQVCGASYEPRRRGSRYCSPRCRQAAHRHRNGGAS